MLHAPSVTEAAMRGVRQASSTIGSVLCRSSGLTKLCSQRQGACTHLLPAVAWHGSSRACLEMPHEGVPELCSVARARREARRCWCGGRGGHSGACHAKAVASPSYVSSQSECLSTARSRQPCTAQTGTTATMAVEGVPESCCTKRARLESRRKGYGRRQAPLGACPAETAASPSHVSSQS